MTIISSKQYKQLETLKADNASLQQKLQEVELKLEDVKEQPQVFASIEAALKEEKTEMESLINNLKQDFSGQLNTLKAQLEALTQEKAQVVEQAKVEVEQAKEIKAEVIQEKVMEGVAVKVATMGLKEEELPTVSINLENKYDRYKIGRSVNTI